jgi:hypothetical protein
VITADALPKVTAFLDQPFMKDLPGSGSILNVRRWLLSAAGQSGRRSRPRPLRTQAR